jgi:hypothetical protein
VQLRRILLLFALVLGLSALVASVVSPPAERDEPSRGGQNASPEPSGVARGNALRFDAAPRSKPADVPIRRAVAGSRVSIEVFVPRPGDVTIPRLGLRRSGDALAPPRLDLLAPASGRYEVVFEPVRGPARVVGRIAVEETATVRRRERGR